MKRINVTTAPYSGDVEFPEASSYPEFVAEQLTERYGAEVDCDDRGLETKVFLHGFGEDESALHDEILALVKIALWDEFCDHGYKAYTKKTEIRPGQWIVVANSSDMGLIDRGDFVGAADTEEEAVRLGERSGYHQGVLRIFRAGVDKGRIPRGAELSEAS